MDEDRGFPDQLLVVIAIIAILMAIRFYHAPGRAGRPAACQAIKQLTTGG
jgi:hypothetical protein